MLSAIFCIQAKKEIDIWIDRANYSLKKLYRHILNNLLALEFNL